MVTHQGYFENMLGGKSCIDGLAFHPEGGFNICPPCCFVPHETWLRPT